MDIQNLIHMANRIGEFFQAMPDRDEAKRGIREHISKFWEPRMRRALQTELAAERASQLSELVKEALTEAP